MGEGCEALEGFSAQPGVWLPSCRRGVGYLLCGGRLFRGRSEPLLAATGDRRTVREEGRVCGRDVRHNRPGRKMATHLQPPSRLEKDTQEPWHPAANHPSH